MEKDAEEEMEEEIGGMSVEGEKGVRGRSLDEEKHGKTAEEEEGDKEEFHSGEEEEEKVIGRKQ